MDELKVTGKGLCLTTNLRWLKTRDILSPISIEHQTEKKYYNRFDESLKFSGIVPSIN